MAPTLHLLCAGAAKGLVEALAERFTAETGAVLAATFGAVGAMRDALLAGAPCDVLVTTESMAASLAASGSLRDEACAVLGRVATGMTVRAGQAAPDVSNADALRTALLAAGAVYHPDALRSTAGIHFAGVLRQLGIAEALAARLQPFPNGATAMLALAASTSPRAIGCTQVSEIMYTPGVALVGVLPAPFELATSYAAAATTHATEPDLAQRFVALLTGAATLALRQASGFEC
jgi:molybdate transport system substrate-binding protein